MKVCKVCGKEIKVKFLEHLRKEHNLLPQQYYDQYLKQEGEGICVVCGNPVLFNVKEFRYSPTCSKSCTMKHTHNKIQADPEQREKWAERSREQFKQAWADPEHREKWKQMCSETAKKRAGKPKGEKQPKLKNENEYQKQVFDYQCPFCSYRYRGNSSRSLKQHITQKHHISQSDWIDFLRSVYWPKYYPDQPTHCLVCGKPTKFIDFGDGFKKFCSNSCASLYTRNSDIKLAIQRKREIENEEALKDELGDRYKEEHFRRVCQEKYGVDHFSQAQEIKDKKKQTCLEKYGAETNFQSDEGKRKLQEYWDHLSPEDREDLVKRRKQTSLERYGHENPVQSPEYQERIRQNNLEKYGVESHLQAKEIKDKVKATNLERYGVTCTLHSEEGERKVKQTNLERYGFEYSSQSPEIAKKISEKNKERFYFETVVRKLHYNGLALLSSKLDYVQGKSLVLKCTQCGHEFVYNIYNNDTKVRYLHCPKCYVNCHSSSYEERIYQFLISQGVEVFRNKRLVRINDKNLEIDLYLPEYKVGVEVDGLYWHSQGDFDRHINKTNALREQHNALLLHFTDSEIDTKFEVVQSIILSKCGIYKNRIYARKCRIEELSEKEYRNFVENYHIQGYATAQVRLGMFYEGQLVAVSAFSTSRFKNKQGMSENELIRFCCLPYTQVIGGLSKFVKFYLRNYPSDNSLVSFCDLRYSYMNGYLASGFKQGEISGPKYWYWSNSEYWLHNRRSFQKSRLASKLKNYDPNLTEEENCFNNGWYRYYDCGSIKMLYTGNQK